jgi:SAM-dependent methyltransferase
MLSSKRNKNFYYAGLLENTAPGLHAKASRLFQKHALLPCTVLDLGGGSGAWPKRLHDASYSVTFCDIKPQGEFEFPYRQIDLNKNFADEFSNQQFDAVCLVEVIEHLENPRHTFRQLRSLLKKGGVVILTTPNASGLYSRVRFFFTGQMAMFTDGDYGPGGHITPMTVWQLEKVFIESGFTVLERMFHDAPFLPPRSLGDLAKIVCWISLRPLMLGTVGGQNIMYVLKKQEV